jgi:hypothetical protein
VKLQLTRARAALRCFSQAATFTFQARAVFDPAIEALTGKDTPGKQSVSDSPIRWIRWPPADRRPHLMRRGISVTFSRW